MSDSVAPTDRTGKEQKAKGNKKDSDQEKVTRRSARHLPILDEASSARRFAEGEKKKKKRGERVKEFHLLSTSRPPAACSAIFLLPPRLHTES